MRHVEMACRMKRNVGKLVTDCEVELSVWKNNISLYSTLLGSHNINMDGSVGEVLGNFRL